MRVFESLTDFIAAEGESLGTTSWMEVTQAKVDLFADATGDHQWIHTDPARAAEGPFGGTIAHGLFTLSLLPVFLHELYSVEGISMAVNYGLNKVRFPAPVPVGSRVRATSTIDAVEKLEGAAQGTISTVIEVEGTDRPACIVQSIVRYYA